MQALSLFAALIVCLLPDPALAWGPVAHLAHGARVLGDLNNLPDSLQRLLEAQRWAYLYGCVGADMIQAKRSSGSIYTHCHNWRVGWKVLQEACGPEEEAFAWGYLSHLAADIYSHNYFLPIQLLATYPSQTRRHVYWEARFDAHLPRDHRALLREVAARRSPACDALVERVVEGTLFSFGTHKRIFRVFVALQHLERWQRALRRITARSRFQLPVAEIERYLSLCIAGIQELLQNGEQSVALQHDPNGHESLAKASEIRRKLQSLRRRRGPVEELRRRYLTAFIEARDTGEVPEISSPRS